jgi:hypothetical protein
VTDVFELHGITITLDDIIRVVEETDEAAWQEGVVRSIDGTRNCFFGHLHAHASSLAASLPQEIIPAAYLRGAPHLTAQDFVASRAWEWFEETFASTYVIYPLNDGPSKRYPQPTPRQRILAFLRALQSGFEMTTCESMDAEYDGLVGGEQCGVAYAHDPFIFDDGRTVCRRCDKTVPHPLRSAA